MSNTQGPHCGTSAYLSVTPDCNSSLQSPGEALSNPLNSHLSLGGLRSIWGSGVASSTDALGLTDADELDDYTEPLGRTREHSSTPCSESRDPRSLQSNASGLALSDQPIEILLGGGSGDTSPHVRRKRQNRAAQRAFRERKAQHVRDLEAEIRRLSEELQTRDAVDASTASCVISMNHLSNALRQGGGTVALAVHSPGTRGNSEPYMAHEILVRSRGEDSWSQLSNSRYAGNDLSGLAQDDTDGVSNSIF